MMQELDGIFLEEEERECMCVYVPEENDDEEYESLE